MGGDERGGKRGGECIDGVVGECCGIEGVSWSVGD